MSTVTIRRDKGSQIRSARPTPAEEVRFIGWNPNRTAFYAMAKGAVSVVTMAPVLPEGARWKGGPFPESAPVHVGPVHLMAPPCRRTEEDWDTDRPKGWELTYLSARHVGLHLEPEDEAGIERFLEGFRKLSRSEYRWRSQEARAIGNRAERVGRLKELALDYCDQGTGRDGKKFGGFAKVTAGMVRDGLYDLWAAYLLSVWMQTEGVTESEMLAERTRLREWLRARAYYNARVFGPKPVHSRTTVPVEFNGDTDPDLLETCARVMLVATFLDGSAAYLSGIDIRDRLSAADVEELWELYGIEVEASREEPRPRAVTLRGEVGRVAQS